MEYGNVYYSPEKYGLTIVAEYDLRVASYEFDIRCVWKDGEGLLYTAHDSGCSCPLPFEDYRSVKDLERLTSMDMLKEEHRKHVEDGREGARGWDEFKEKVAAALREARK